MTARDADLIRMYQRGSSLRECGEAFGITLVRAQQILKMHRIPRRRPGKPSPNQRLDAFVRKASHTIILEPTPETAAIIAMAMRKAA